MNNNMTDAINANMIRYNEINDQIHEVGKEMEMMINQTNHLIDNYPREPVKDTNSKIKKFVKSLEFRIKNFEQQIDHIDLKILDFSNLISNVLTQSSQDNLKTNVMFQRQHLETESGEQLRSLDANSHILKQMLNNLETLLDELKGKAGMAVGSEKLKQVVDEAVNKSHEEIHKKISMLLNKEDVGNSQKFLDKFRLVDVEMDSIKRASNSIAKEMQVQLISLVSEIKSLKSLLRDKDDEIKQLNDKIIEEINDLKDEFFNKLKMIEDTRKNNLVIRYK